MAWGLVQSLKSTPTATASTAVTAAFASNVTSGNRLFMFTGSTSGTGSNLDIAAPVKSAGTGTISVFTELVSCNQATQGFRASIWTCTVTGTGSLTLSATSTSPASSELGWTAQEYSGLDSSAGTGCVDQSAAGTANSANTTNASTGTTAATAAANQLGLAVVADWGTTSATWTLATANGFTKVAAASIDANNNTNVAMANKTSAAAATESCIWTCGGVSNTDGACVAVIKLAGAAPPVINLTMAPPTGF